MAQPNDGTSAELWHSVENLDDDSKSSSPTTIRSRPSAHKNSHESLAT